MSESPVRVQRKRTKGWRMPEHTVYVGRPSDFANPYRLLPHGKGWRVRGHGCTWFGDEVPLTREQAATIAVEEFERKYGPGSNNAYWAQVRLKGRNLACWCPLDQPCHADVLLKVANS